MPSSEVMHKWKAGTLHSGSKSGPPVKSQKQAIAIMLSEKRKEGQHGGKYPHKQLGGPQGPTGMPPLPPAAHPSSMAPPYMGGVGSLPGMGPTGLGGSPMGMRADGGNVSDAERRVNEKSWISGQSAMDRAKIPFQLQKQGLAYYPKGTAQAPSPFGTPQSAQEIEDAVRGGGLGYQFGGSPTSMGLTPGWIERQEARGMTHTGPIISAVGGRTDSHAINVPSGSYVIPSAHVAALGQGNTLSGMKILQGMFGPPMKLTHGAGPPRPPAMMRPPRLTSSGGSRGDEHVGRPVPIMAAGGEYVLSPDQVSRVGGGDLNHGHRVLDKWVQNTHKKFAKTIANLPPPAKT